MLIIKHLTGPLKDKEDRIDPKLDRVVFGRNLDCQVVYPPEYTIVSREHFALDRKPPGPAGHWTVDLFGEPYVAINGVPAEQGQAVTEGETFELGAKRGGASFRVHFEAEAPFDNKAQTGRQQKRPNVFVVSSFARRIAILGTTLAVLTAVAGTWAYRTVAVQIPADVREHLRNATFLVEAPEGGATAVVLDPSMFGPNTPNRVLATNGHVAALYDELKPGEQMLVRSPGENGPTYQVIKREAHPGYKAFQAFLNEDVLRTRIAQLDEVGGYDVALLWVNQDLKDDKGQPIVGFDLATTDELKALASGTVVATAGYPMESVTASGSQIYGATPEYHDGAITSLTDFFFRPADFARAQLIHHDLAAAGGSSGSPIVGRSGHLLALLSAGNVYQPNKNGPRIPSGVMINYGQRIDLLQHLINGDAAQEVQQDQQYWQQQIKPFDTGPTIVVKLETQQIQEDDNNDKITLDSVSQQASTLSQQDRIKSAKGDFQRQFDYQIPVSTGSKYVFLAYAFDGSPIQVWVYNGNQRVAQDDKQSYVATVRYQATNNDKLDVWVIAPEDKDVNYWFMAEKLKVPGT
ncbi:MAG TPA: trypsin-like peptidase domain-containing protein [Methylovirgula sp.]|nr:trypsin-like peptidase domain-containing protein [Methylovirgula sp.]